MSTLFPDSKPFALHIMLAAETQSGAPLAVSWHVSWPLTARADGMRAIAPAASLAPATVVLAALPAALLKPSTFLRASSNDEVTVAVCSLNQRLTVAKKLSLSRLFRAGVAWSCAAANADMSINAAKNN